MPVTNKPILSAADALAILHAQDCTVKLHISMGTYTTHHNDTSFDLIYVEGFNEYVHFHNIKSIRCLNINKSDPEAEFIEIDWSTDTY